MDCKKKFAMHTADLVHIDYGVLQSIGKKHELTKQAKTMNKQFTEEKVSVTRTKIERCLILSIAKDVELGAPGWWVGVCMGTSTCKALSKKAENALSAEGIVRGKKCIIGLVPDSWEPHSDSRSVFPLQTSLWIVT